MGLCVSSGNSDIPDKHQKLPITPTILEARCNTLQKILTNLQNKNIWTSEKYRLHKKVTRIVNITKYGMRITKNEYTPYALDTITKSLDDFDYAITFEKYDIAQEHLMRILVEKNNYF
jgi:hypothetical protein